MKFSGHFIKEIKMKNKIIITFILLNQFFLISCKKENSSCKLIPTKLIRFDCDRVIFQLLSSENIGDATWTDIKTGIQYSNVVAYSNTCAINFINNGILVYDTLYVNPIKLNDRVIVPDCFQCQAISDNPPLTNVDFLSISLTPCTN